MNLIISGELSAPPSEVMAFRDVTLYATIFRNMDCLVEVSREDFDFYYSWLKRTGSWDFVCQMVDIGEESGIVLKYDVIDKITFNNLRDVIGMI